MAARRFRFGMGHATLVALALLLALALRSATWTVQQNEEGVVFRFGRVARALPPGFHLTLPWPLERLERVRTTELRTMPIGYRLIDRAEGRPPTSAESQFLTGDTNVVELEATLLYSIDDPVLYLTGSAPGADGASRDFAVRKACEAVLTRLVASLSVDEALSSGKTELGRRAQREAQELCDALRLGVGLRALNIVSVQPPADVIGAFNDVTTARSDRDRRVAEAQGYRSSSLPKARAAANTRLRAAEIEREALLARARGSADAFSRLADEAAKHPDLVRRRLWLAALERIFAKVRTRVLPPVEEGETRRVFLER